MASDAVSSSPSRSRSPELPCIMQIQRREDEGENVKMGSEMGSGAGDTQTDIITSIKNTKTLSFAKLCIESQEIGRPLFHKTILSIVKAT